MPLLGCTNCHHEWEASKLSPCDWCGEPSAFMLSCKTGLEQMIEDMFRGDRPLMKEIEKKLK
jgi:hypothetical protein